MEWLAPSMALAGVFAGALLTSFLTRRAAETTWLRDTRLERYTKLLHEIDSLVDSFDNVLEVFASVEDFASREEWVAAVEQRASVLEERSDKVRWTAAELSLFTSAAVNERAQGLLQAISYLLKRFGAGLEGAQVENADGAPPGTVIDPRVGDVV